MRSRTTDSTAPAAAGASRVRRAAGTATTVAAAAAFAASAIAGSAAAAPGPVLWPDPVCAYGVLPIRIGAFQSPPGDGIDLTGTLDRSEFRSARPLANLSPGWGSVHVVVLAYAGNLAPDLVLELRDAGGEVTASLRRSPSPPHRGVAATTLHPEYLRFELPRGAWPQAFPHDGLYLLTARAAEHDDPAAPVAPVCAAVAHSWLFVVR